MNQLPPFTQSIIRLAHCDLTKTIFEDDALTLSALLANSEPWATLNFSAKRLENYFLHEDVALHRYVVRIGGEVAGVACVRYPWLRGPYIELMGLTNEYRELGIGTELLQWAEIEAQKGAKNLWVVCSAFNHRALQFYQRHDFHIIGTLKGLVHLEYDEILLRKSWD